VAVALQPSLFDALPSPAPGGALRRTVLGHGAWIDRAERWLADDGTLFDRLAATVAWRAERRPMYDRVVDVPRLLAFYDSDDEAPDPALVAARRMLSAYYARESGDQGDPLATYGLAYYRDGRDSVAWHGDRIGRARTHDTIVAIVSLGATRRLLLRPRGGGRSMAIAMSHGDLLVMGGSCQRTWEHAVPKTAVPIGPRISVQLRAAGVR
jgi:alkylated DNA repair dioxygenase AlkB